MSRLSALLVLFAVACAGSSDGADGDAPTDAPCQGSDCVTAWNEADIPLANADEVVLGADGVLHLAERLVVLFDDPDTSAATAGQVLARHGGSVEGSLPVGLFFGRFAGADEAALEEALQALEAEEGVAHVGRDVVVTGGAEHRPGNDLDRFDVALSSLVAYGGAGVDAFYVPETADDAWRAIDIHGAWEAIWRVNPSIAPVRVGVLDGEVLVAPVFTGASMTDPAEARLVGPSENELHHGTAVASIIMAPLDGKGTNGVMTGLPCLDATLVPIAVLGRPLAVPTAPGTDVIASRASLRGAMLAIQAGVQVANLSFGLYGSDMDDRSYALLDAAWHRVFAASPDILWVTSAGNRAVDAGRHLPSAVAVDLDNVISVGATGTDDRIASFSNFGAAVTLSAPGVDVLAHHPDGALVLFRGTSAAAPVVTGVASLIRSVDPSLRPDQVRDLLTRTGVDAPDSDRIGRRIDARAALEDVLAGVEGAGQGTCRTGGTFRDCPGGAVCSWCVEGTVELDWPLDPSRSGRHAFDGTIVGNWQGGELASAGINGTGPTAPDGAAYLVGAIVSSFTTHVETDTHLEVAGGGGGGFGMPDPQFPDSGDAWPSDMHFDLSFADHSVDGTVELVGDGAAAHLVFSGRLAADEDLVPEGWACRR